MNYRMIGHYISRILLVEAAFMLPAVLVTAIYREMDAAAGFLSGITVTLVFSGVLALLSRGAKGVFRAREGLVCVGLCWVCLSLCGAIPFLVSGEIPGFVDALFETVSGFTTTGASVVEDVESLSHGALYWRSFSQWLGGMGVLVFLLAVIPSVERGSGFTMHILRAESPGPEVGKLVPHIKKTAEILYLIYVLLTAANFVALVLGRMPVFEALCTAFSTAGTGGFSIKADSMASYSPYLQNVTTIFMALFGVNFTCYYLLLLKQFRVVARNEELLLYLGLTFGSAALLAWNIRSLCGSLGETLRHACFQTASLLTTTGFATTDFNQWPAFSKVILLLLMLVGGCAGSTAGGLKCGRVLLLGKGLHRAILQAQHPQRATVVRSSGRAVKENVLENTYAYLVAYAAIFLLSTLLVSLGASSATDSLLSVLFCVNNIGSGLGPWGPLSCYAAFSPLAKLVLIFDMLAGRLELFPLLVLFSRSTWRNR